MSSEASWEKMPFSLLSNATFTVPLGVSAIPLFGRPPSHILTSDVRSTLMNSLSGKTVSAVFSGSGA